MANTEVTKSEASSAGLQSAAAKLRKILVSVNLENSAAVDYALELAKISGLHFVLLHVIETPRSAFPTMKSSIRQQYSLPT
jgi:hypothetical protein